MQVADAHPPYKFDYTVKIGDEIRYFFDDFCIGKKKHYPDGQLQETVWHQNKAAQGHITREQKIYHPNGFLRSHTHFDGSDMNGKGKKWGQHKEYYENGQLKTAGSYCDGKKAGCWEAFYPHGVRRHEKNYGEGSVQTARYFDENGVEQPHFSGFYMGNGLARHTGNFVDSILDICQKLTTSSLPGNLESVRIARPVQPG